MVSIDDAAATIRALALPDAPALSAVIAEAVAMERERFLALVAQIDDFGPIWRGELDIAIKEGCQTMDEVDHLPGDRLMRIRARAGGTTDAG